MGEVVIWGEVLFCIDFCMDFCALYFCAKWLGWSTNTKHLCLGSALSAAFGVICTASETLLLKVMVSLVALSLSIFILIPKQERRISRRFTGILLFFFLETCVGGIMTTVFYFLNRQFSALGFRITDENARYRLFFLIAAGIFFLLGIIHRKLDDADCRKLVQRGGTASIRLHGKEAAIPCLFDSGNLVKEPISGKPVVFVPHHLQHTLGIVPDSLESGTMMGSRLIPMKTLDSSSLRWGIQPDAISFQADSISIPYAEVYMVFSNQIKHAIVPTALLKHAAQKRKDVQP